MSFGERLATLMRRAGLKNPDVAAAARVDATTVSKWRTDVQEPDDAKLALVAQLLATRGITTSVAYLRHGEDGTNYVSSSPIARAMGVVREGSELRFTSPTSAQKGRVWLETFLLELAEQGAGDEFLESTRRLLLNPSNYEHGFGAAAGHRDEMDDDQKLRHMQALAVGVRAALKDRLKKGGRGK